MENNSANWTNISTITIESTNQTSLEQKVLTLFKLTILILIILLAILSNLLVISSVLIFRRLRHINNYFLVSLAVADLSVALFAMTFNATVEITGSWHFGPIMCNFWNAMDVHVSTVSTLHLCCISIDRFYAIVKPFSYVETMTVRMAMSMILFAWLSPAFISFVPIFLGWYTTQEHLDQRQNHLDECRFIVNKPYAIISSTLTFWAPVLITLILYYRVFLVAREIEKRECRSHSCSIPRASIVQIRYPQQNTDGKNRNTGVKDQNAVMNEQNTGVKDQNTGVKGQNTGVKDDIVEIKDRGVAFKDKNVAMGNQNTKLKNTYIIENTQKESEINDNDLSKYIELNCSGGKDCSENKYTSNVKDGNLQLQTGVKCCVQHQTPIMTLTNENQGVINKNIQQNFGIINTDPYQSFELIDADPLFDLKLIKTSSSHDLELIDADLAQDLEWIDADSAQDIEWIDADSAHDLDLIDADLSHDVKMINEDSGHEPQCIDANLGEKHIHVLSSDSHPNLTEMRHIEIPEQSRKLCESENAELKLWAPGHSLQNKLMADKPYPSAHFPVTQKHRNIEASASNSSHLQPNNDCDCEFHHYLPNLLATNLAIKEHPVNIGNKPQILLTLDYLNSSGEKTFCLLNVNQNLSKDIVINGENTHDGFVESTRRLSQQSITVIEGVREKQRRWGTNWRKEHKAFVTLGLLVGAFLLCWLPFFTWYLTVTICGSHCSCPDIIVSVLFWIGYLNSTLNPVIYAMTNHDFKEAFTAILTKICCCDTNSLSQWERNLWAKNFG